MYLDDTLETIFVFFLVAMMGLWLMFLGFFGISLLDQPTLSTLSGQVIKTKIVDASSSDAEYKITVKPENGNAKKFKLDPTVSSYVKKGDTVKIRKYDDDDVKSIEKLNG